MSEIHEDQIADLLNVVKARPGCTRTLYEGELRRDWGIHLHDSIAATFMLCLDRGLIRKEADTRVMNKTYFYLTEEGNDFLGIRAGLHPNRDAAKATAQSTAWRDQTASKGW